MIKSLNFLSILAIGMLPLQSVGASPTVDQKCDRETNSEIISNIASAIATAPKLSGRIVVKRCGEIIFETNVGLADRSTGEHISAKTVFDIGSLTKQFVAAGILQLRDEGKLSLKQTLGDYFDGLPATTAGITLKQLLTHSSGLPKYSGDDYDIVSKEQFIQWLIKTELDFAPGTSESYSNVGFTALTVIIEKITNEQFEHFLRSRFFNRLNLSNTGYRWPRGPIAVNYASSGERAGTPLEGAWQPYGPYWNLMGNGGILSTADDMQLWFSALREGRILSKRSTNEMFQRHVQKAVSSTSAHGYGWRINDDELGHWINHGGSNGISYYADVRHFSASDATMVMTLNMFDIETIRLLVRAFARKAASPN